MKSKISLILGIISACCIFISIVGLALTSSYMFLLPVPVLFITIGIAAIIISVKAAKKENDDK